jgi:two-component system, NtrC family, sensor histidine kinase HydH
MTHGSGSAGGVTSLVLPTLLVVGDAPEISADTRTLSVVRARTSEPPVESSFAAMVFDLRTETLAELFILRTREAFSGAPLLLASDVPIADKAFALLRADDGVVVGEVGQPQLTRRLAVLMELGRLRRVASIAEKALLGARTETESLHRMLADRERFDHAVLDGIDVGIVTTDSDRRITFVNRVAATLLDIRQEDVGIGVERVLGLERAPNELLGRESRRTLPHQLRAGEGAELDLELTISRAEGASDERSGFFFIFRDVRAEKQRETERARFERLAAMGTMVAGFAHEVRNPIAAMRSVAEELEEELRESGVTTPHVRVMLVTMNRIERLVATSLQFGRPAMPKRASHRPVDIASSAVVEIRARLRGGVGHEVLAIDAEPDLPNVNVDERQLAQALVILLNNALDATGQVARVSMRIRQVKAPDQEGRGRKSEPPPIASVRFEVVDDGPGIPPDIVGRIFDPFFTTKAAGTGLGLSIAQQIVSENGARLEVTSTPAPATTFSIVVPAECAGSD